jgi:bifunctional non-homologous end joining protein LigD
LHEEKNSKVIDLREALKASVGKGYRIVVPLKPAVTWDGFHDFARRVAEVMEQKWPDRYTSNNEVRQC